MREARKMFFVWGRRNSHHSLLGTDGGAIHYRTKDMLNQKSNREERKMSQFNLRGGASQTRPDKQTDLPFIVGGVLFVDIHILTGTGVDNENNNNFM